MACHTPCLPCTVLTYFVLSSSRSRRAPCCFVLAGCQLPAEQPVWSLPYTPITSLKPKFFRPRCPKCGEQHVMPLPCPCSFLSSGLAVLLYVCKYVHIYARSILIASAERETPPWWRLHPRKMERSRGTRGSCGSPLVKKGTRVCAGQGTADQ